jgi:hypothetical protein
MQFFILNIILATIAFFNVLYIILESACFQYFNDRDSILAVELFIVNSVDDYRSLPEK